ncbi:MAG: hypothetical protein HYU69_03200 [Bacteroidetes bacterium]|nr:hypothetical protein [Bacteroidota bacterium]
MSLKQQFRNKHFKVMKGYLFQAVLKSLSDYHRTDSVESELQQLLHQTKLLERKKLIEIALKLLIKAEKLAAENEKHEYLILIVFLRINIIRKSELQERMKNYLMTDAVKINDYIRHVKNHFDLQKLRVMVKLINDKGIGNSNKVDRNTLKSIMKSPLLSSSNKTLTFSSLQTTNFIRFVCSNVLNKWDDRLYKKQKGWLDYIERRNLKFPKAMDAGNYLGELSIFMIVQIKTNRTEEIEQTFDKGQAFYASLPLKMKDGRLIEMFTNLTLNYMGGQLDLIKPDKVIEAHSSLKKKISQRTVSNSSGICFNLCYSYFLLTNYRQTLFYANQILNKKDSARLDIQKKVRLLFLLAHFELGNYDLLPGISKSVLRWDLKNNLLNDFEKTALNFFLKEKIWPNNRNERINTFKQLQQNMSLIHDRNKESFLAQEFDFISWLESKIQNRPFAEIMREKAKVIKVR